MGEVVRESIPELAERDGDDILGDADRDEVLRCDAVREQLGDEVRRLDTDGLDD